MKAKQVQESDFDIKKWGMFALFLAVLGIMLVVINKPKGETNARNVIDQSRLLNRKARELALKSNSPQDLANLDQSTDSLSKANAFFIESEFSAAVEEALKSSRYADKIINRSEGATFGASIRFAEIVGEVMVRKKGERDYAVATSTTTLSLGDELRTQDNSACQLFHKDGTKTSVHPSTRLFFQEDLDSLANEAGMALFLEEGSVQLHTTSKDKSRFHILSNWSKALAYHDTDVTCRLLPDDEEMEIRVRVGRVDARSGNRSIVVTSNQRLAFSTRRFEGEGQSVLPAPTLESPVSSSKFPVNKNGFSPVTLNWRAQENAGNYHVEVSDDILFVNKIEDKNPYIGTRIHFPDMRPGVYFWRVTALDRLGLAGMTSDGFSFEVVNSDDNLQLGTKEPPKLTIREAVVQGDIVIIQGNTSINATVKLNGEVADVNNETGVFRHVLRLHGYGKHTVNVVAESSTGTIAFKNLSIDIKD